MYFFLVTWTLKAEQFVQLVVEKKVREIQSVSRTPGSPAGAEMEGHMTRMPVALETEWTWTDSQQGNVSISPTATGTESFWQPEHHWRQILL